MQGSLRHARVQLRRDRSKSAEWETFEVAEYISSAKASSDRVRHIIYVLLTVSLLIALGNWNTYPQSWAQWRMSEWARRQWDGDPPLEPLFEKQRDEIMRRNILNEYPQQYVQRMLVVDVPIVGIAVDVNDFGLLGGVVLAVLLSILLFSVARMHDNLYLAIFKIRKLVEEDRRAWDGESRANFLYHALAMGQVLYRPPTLARWKPRHSYSMARVALRFAVLTPLAVHANTVWDNWHTLGIARAYRRLTGETAPNRFWLQVVLLLIIFALTALCWIYGRATDQRWRNAFFRINHHLRFRQPAPWPVWVRIRSRWSAKEKHLKRELVALLLGKNKGLGSLSATDEAIRVRHTVRWPEKTTQRAVRSAAFDLMRAARRAARTRCERRGIDYLGLTSFVFDKDVAVQNGLLHATMTWTFRYRTDVH